MMIEPATLDFRPAVERTLPDRNFCFGCSVLTPGSVPQPPDFGSHRQAELSVIYVSDSLFLCL